MKLLYHGLLFLQVEVTRVAQPSAKNKTENCGEKD
jgi:hypothetical protein